MKVRELVKWLSEFEDQDAEVQIVKHLSAGGYYEQGGTASVELFDPEMHSEYSDLRGNPFIHSDAPYYNSRTLLLGEINS